MSARRVIVNDPTVDLEYEDVEFRLTYHGLLLSDQDRHGRVEPSRAKHKQEIRKQLHLQLKRLWEISPYLSTPSRPPPAPLPLPGTLPVTGIGRVLGRPDPKHTAAHLANRFSRNGYRFVPLVLRELELLCGIEILFLRMGDPGGVINRVGDLDNRLKTLFDALTMPRDASQLGPYAEPDSGEDPFYCLLEDDSVITKATVESDRLLEPISTPSNENDARVVITVRLRAGRVNASNIGFG
jgi:hypothetical protein